MPVILTHPYLRSLNKKATYKVNPVIFEVRPQLNLIEGHK